MAAVSIPKGPIQLAGLLHKPSQPSRNVPAIIVVHPGGGVKEQTADLYARQLAARGFVTLCFDAAHQGASGGEPRFLEDPAARVSDVWSAVDYLQQHHGGDAVDPARIGVLGICAGGGYAVAAAKADYRIKAVATVSMLNIGDSARLGWTGDEDPSTHVESLRQAAAQLAAEAVDGAEASTAPYVTSLPDENTPRDLRDASEYYLTHRGRHPRAENRMLFRSLPRVITFDAFHLADLFLKQPTLLIAGEKAGSRWHTEKLDRKIRGATKKVIVPGGTHVDFYDRAPFVNVAAQEIAEFMSSEMV